jgi:hypothetical protein
MNRRKEDTMRQRLAVLLAAAVVLATTAGPAVAASGESTSQEVAYGAGSFFGTLLYAPAKLGFCVVGAVTSGLTLPFGGPQTAGKVATAACGGTWVITPATLKGREPVQFVGQ